MDDNRDMVWITIGNYDSFELVQAERSEQAESLAAAETQQGPAEKPFQEQKAPAKPQITTPTLPDLFAFIGGNGAQMDQSSQDGEVG